MATNSQQTPVRVGHADARAEENTRVRAVGHYVLGVLRLVVGFTFLWAFLDKLLALGYSTGVDAETGAVDRFGDAAWIHSGNPTEGFLAFGAKGPFESFYHSIAGDAWTNLLFMAALLAIGLAFMLGVCTRLAAAAGALLYLMMWSVVLPPANNPVVDDHILGMLVCLLLGLYAAGRYLGLGRWWEQQAIVSRFPILK